MFHKPVKRRKPLLVVMGTECKPVVVVLSNDSTHSFHEGMVESHWVLRTCLGNHNHLGNSWSSSCLLEGSCHSVEPKYSRRRIGTINQSSGEVVCFFVWAHVPGSNTHFPCHPLCNQPTQVIGSKCKLTFHPILMGCGVPHWLNLSQKKACSVSILFSCWELNSHLLLLKTRKN